MSRWVIWLPHICLFIYNNLIINFKFNSSVLRKYNWGTSLVVPRWRMDLPTQGTWVWPLIGKTKIPTWREATKPGSCGEKATQRGRVSTADITKHQNMIKKLTMCSLHFSPLHFTEICCQAALGHASVTLWSLKKNVDSCCWVVF